MSLYDFVPLPPDAQRRARGEARHDQRVAGMLSGRLVLQYVCRQPVHVGSGFKDLRDNGEVIRLGARSGDVGVVPGSTFKGALRARYEASTKSCLLFEVRSPQRSKSRTFGDSASTKLGKGSVDQIRGLTRACSGRQTSVQPDAVVCPACALFGCLNLRARVNVSDLLPLARQPLMDSAVPALFEPRLHHVGTFHVDDQEHTPSLVMEKLHGRKFAQGATLNPEAKLAVETFARDSRLRGEIRMWNLSKAELGGLLLAVGALPASALKLGAAKGHGFGRIDLVEYRLTLVDERRSPITANISEFQQAFQGSADYWAEGALKLVALHSHAKL